jgi:hypothetical protein
MIDAEMPVSQKYWGYTCYAQRWTVRGTTEVLAKVVEADPIQRLLNGCCRIRDVLDIVIYTYSTSLEFRPNFL